MKTIRFCLILSVFIACILPTHSAAQRVQSKNNFLSKYTLVDDDVDTDATRFNPCIKSIASKVCIIDSKIDHLNPGVSSGCDQIEAALESCCEILNSKIDITNSILQTFNLSTIELISSEIEILASKAEQAVSNVEIIVSLSEIVEENLVSFVEIISNIENAVASCCAATDASIDSCCTHLEDVIESCCSIPDGSITSCCEQLGSQLTVIDSKIDNINPASIESCCTHLENVIESCCDRLENAIASCSSSPDGSIDSCCEQLGSKLTIIDNKIDNLSPAAIDSCCEVISSKLDAACGATAIHQSDVLAGGATGYLITQPGHYCVAENLVGGANAIITISASDVHLDLNGYELQANFNGILIDSTVTHSGIVIENGFMVGNGSLGFYGILWPGALGSNGLTVAALSIRNFGFGIYLQLIDNIKLLDCNISYNVLFNLILGNCNNIFIDQCFIEHSKGPGSNLQNCSSVIIQNSSFNNNSYFGLSLQTPTNSHVLIENTFFNNNNTINDSDSPGCLIVSNLAHIKFVHCSFSITDASAFVTSFQTHGLQAEGSSSVYLESCQAHNNINSGFFLNSGNRATLLNCQATNNGHVSVLSSDGFHFTSMASVEMKDCYAAQNRENGYFLNTVNASLFTNCTAERNGKASGAGSGFNITTCSDISLDHCTALDNRTDGFALGAAVTGLLKECTALGNDNFGFSDATVSTPVQYYANNSCNNAGGNYSLSIKNQNHAPVTSPANAHGVDNVDCSSSDLDQIDLIQSCCETINSKIDNLNSVSINSCCEQLSSKLTIIDSKIDNLSPIAIISCCDRVENAIESCCAKTDASINSCCEQLGSKLTIIDSKIDHLNPGTNDSCCEIIISKLDATCGATAIHQSDVNMDPINGYVIAQPGHYCVAENLVGGGNGIITISTSDVTLDLNGYELTASTTSTNGIVMTTTVSRGVVIRNGFIVGAGEDSDGDGISLSSTSSGTRSEDIGIYDVSIRNFDLGIVAFGIKNLVVENCRCEDSNGIGLAIFACQQVRIWRSIFLSAFIGIVIIGIQGIPAANIQIEQCSINNNLVAGLLFLDTQCCQVINCQASNDILSGVSLAFTTSGTCSDILFKDCKACNFGTGFDIAQDSSGIILNSCTAQNNIDGFNFSTTSAITSLIKNCSALNNIGFGFKDTSVAQNLYENNTACGNGTNYDATITSAPVTSPANARGVMNVDCSNSDLDQIDVLDSKIDACCSALNNKLDAIMSCISCLA